jgi:hypothetical protein
MQLSYSIKSACEQKIRNRRALKYKTPRYKNKELKLNFLEESVLTTTLKKI